MSWTKRIEAIERAISLLRTQPFSIIVPCPADQTPPPGSEGLGLPFSARPPGAERIADDRAAVVIASTEQTIALALERLRLDATPRATGTEIVLDLRAGAAMFAEAAATGTAREVCTFGTRGDGKTWTALLTMLWHAKLHRDAGHPLPVRWLGITDTGRSHVLKTIPSALAPAWGGIWSVRDDSRLLVATVDGVELVHLILIGIEDQGALDRARMECHAMWLEEPAPAGSMDGSSGVGLEAYLIAATSCRLPSHAHPKIITSNYPDVDHWTWRRFVEEQAPGRLCIRIKPGERASEEQRAEWR